MMREAFVATSRTEAMRLARPYLEVKYRAYRDWGQDKVMPSSDHFDLGFDELVDDRFLIGSPADVAEQIVELRRRESRAVSEHYRQVHPTVEPRRRESVAGAPSKPPMTKSSK